mgnify:CR=1 FL=1
MTQKSLAVFNLSNIFIFIIAHLAASLPGSILESHLGIILRARVVIGAIVGARGAPECLKAGGSYERLFQEGPKEFRLGSDWGGDLHFGLTGAQLPPPGPSPSTEKERKARCDRWLSS